MGGDAPLQPLLSCAYGVLSVRLMCCDVAGHCILHAPHEHASRVLQRDCDGQLPGGVHPSGGGLHENPQTDQGD